MTRVPDGAIEVLEGGRICYLAVEGRRGPHLSPVVFALDGGRIWLTTARSTVKARRWEERPFAAGMVRHGGRAVAFRGRVRRYDALDPSTWPAALLRGPRLAVASGRFTLKNLRYFAGYARDAYRVPFGWTPPGRIFASVDLEDGGELDLVEGAVLGAWGRVGSEVPSRGGFRATRGRLPDVDLPRPVRSVIGAAGDGALAVQGAGGPLALPVRWRRAPEDGAYYAVVPEAFLGLAAPEERGPAALVIDQASRWRAAKMIGVQLRGRADVFVPDRVGSGRRSLWERIRPVGEVPADPAVLRLRVDRIVWWRGWSSGTVRAT